MPSGHRNRHGRNWFRLGTALRNSLLECGDTDAAAAYLESGKDENAPYYECFGFVAGEIHIPAGGPFGSYSNC